MNNDAYTVHNTLRKLGLLSWKSLEEIRPDGSERKFYRIRTAKKYLILMSNKNPATGKNTDENSTYIYISGLFAKNHINVPEIYAISEDKTDILMRDIGMTNLQSWLNRSGLDMEMFGKVMDTALRIGKIKEYEDRYIFNSRYDESFIFREECMYFYENYVNRYIKTSRQKEGILYELKNISEIYRELIYKGFMHRDFQSRNILVENNEPFIIDFQGARQGHRAYDMASIVFDPYTNLYPEHYENICRMIRERISLEKEDPCSFLKEFELVAIYRLLQIIGAFCNLYYNKRKNFFSAYIQKACRNLVTHLENCREKYMEITKEALKSQIEGIKGF